MRGALLVACVAACGARTELGGVIVDTQGDAACAPSTFDLQVPVESPWFDTGIDLASGDDVKMHASGAVRYGPNGPQTTDANGGNFDGQKFFSTAVLPNTVICSLIGKVGDTPVPSGTSGDGPGFVGTDYHETMTTSGRLFLGFNDQVGQFGDNSGAFEVTITIEPPCP